MFDDVLTMTAGSTRHARAATDGVGIIRNPGDEKNSIPQTAYQQTKSFIISTNPANKLFHMQPTN